MKVLISIPAWNEEHTLPLVIQEIKTVMSQTKYNYKIQIVNDGSTDNTTAVAKKAGAIVIEKRHSGLIETFKREMVEFVKSKSDVLVHTDADGQYPAEYIPKLLEQIEQGHDLVIGSRFSGDIEQMPIMKRMGNIAFAKVFTRLCETPISDSTTGFRAFTKEVAESIEYTSDFTYTQEQLLKASRNKFSIKEIPIYARKTRDSRLMKGPFDYAIKAWKNLLRIQRDFNPLAFFGKIGIIFITLGALVGLYVLYSILTIGYSGGIPRVILSALLIMSGIQIVLFGFLADMQKK